MDIFGHHGIGLVPVLVIPVEGPGVPAQVRRVAAQRRRAERVEEQHAVDGRGERD